MTAEGVKAIAPPTDLAGPLLAPTIATDAHHHEIVRVRAPTPGYHLIDHMDDHEVDRLPNTGAALAPRPSRVEAMARLLTGDDVLLRGGHHQDGTTGFDLRPLHGDLVHLTATAGLVMSPEDVVVRGDPEMLRPVAKSFEEPDVLHLPYQIPNHPHERYLQELNQRLCFARAAPLMFYPGVSSRPI